MVAGMSLRPVLARLTADHAAAPIPRDVPSNAYLVFEVLPRQYTSGGKFGRVDNLPESFRLNCQ
jgi:hypothetical protein